MSVSAARSFLQAYWQADLQGALAHCQPGAVIELARSLPIPTPAPVADILPLIFNNVYPKFAGGRFDVTIGATLEQNNLALVEYTARGQLVAGGLFECGYAAVFEFVDGAIARLRMYTDTRYVAAALM